MRHLDRLFTNLETIVDEVHDLLEAWCQQADADAAPGPFGLDVLKLAVHEWIGNLIQHADFGPEPPLIRLTLASDAGRIHCVLEDNSQGFDFARQLVRQRDQLESASQPPERGRGLLLMIACTENLHYGPLPRENGAYLPGPLYHRLEFWLSARSATAPGSQAATIFDAHRRKPAPFPHPRHEAEAS